MTKDTATNDSLEIDTKNAHRDFKKTHFVSATKVSAPTIDVSLWIILIPFLMDRIKQQNAACFFTIIKEKREPCEWKAVAAVA